MAPAYSLFQREENTGALFRCKVQKKLVSLNTMAGLEH